MVLGDKEDERLKKKLIELENIVEDLIEEEEIEEIDKDIGSIGGKKREKIEEIGNIGKMIGKRREKREEKGKIEDGEKKMSNIIKIEIDEEVNVIGEKYIIVN